MPRFIHVFLAFLLPTTLIGCGEGQRKEVSPAKKFDPEAIQKEIAGQLANQLEKRTVDLEKQKLILLIDGIRDKVQRDAITKKALELIDGKLGNYSIVTKGGYDDSTFLEVSPIGDLELSAAKIDFGAVLAVDADKRTIVVDAGSPSTVPAEFVTMTPSPMLASVTRSHSACSRAASSACRRR